MFPTCTQWRGESSLTHYPTTFPRCTQWRGESSLTHYPTTFPRCTQWRGESSLTHYPTTFPSHHLSQVFSIATCTQWRGESSLTHYPTTFPRCSLPVPSGGGAEAWPRPTSTRSVCGEERHDPEDTQCSPRTPRPPGGVRTLVEGEM